MTIRRRLGALFLTGAVVSALMVALGIWSFRQLIDARASLVDEAGPARVAAASLLSALVDQENGVRGYVLARDEAFLGPYTEGREREAADRARLERLLAGDDRLLARYHAAVGAADRWRSAYAEPTVQAVREGRLVVRPNSSRSAIDPGKDLFDAVRRDFGSFDGELQASQVRAAERLDGATRGLVAVLVGGLLLATATAAFLWWALRTWVTEPVEALAADTRLVSGGDLRHRVEPVGQSEVRSLAEDIESMRRRIVDELQSVAEARSELADRNLELARSNVELEQFAYVASHDLQEPLRKVISFCQLLQQRYGGQLDERADQYIAFATDGARRMQVLINDLLAFSRVGRTTAAFAPVDLGACIAEATDTLSEAIAEARGTVEVSGEAPTIPGDRTLLTALFQNLIGNAVKFRGEDPPVVQVETTEAEGLVWCSVTDNGIGIEPRFAERVFVIFQRLHGRDEYAGTGIGLALCRKIVEFHGGRLWLDTEHSGGSRLCFTLQTSAPDPIRNET